jgi:hypothetical protein
LGKLLSRRVRPKFEKAELGWRLTVSFYEMLQPMGPQAAALLAAPANDWLPELRVPKTEKAFSAWVLPQLGHFSSILARLDRTNLSYLLPQS